MLEGEGARLILPRCAPLTSVRLSPLNRAGCVGVVERRKNARAALTCRLSTGLVSE
jgi:hypothetical protein